MEKLQGPILPSLFEEHFEVGCLEEDQNSRIDTNYGQFINTFEDPHYNLPSLEDKMPFLQMLQGVVEAQPNSLPVFPLMQEPNFQLLLRFQQEKISISCFDESCVTNNNNNNNNNNDLLMELHSPVKSEITCREAGGGGLTQNFSSVERENQRKKGGGRSKKTHLLGKSTPDGGAAVSASVPRERRKRKRAARPSKNKEQVESQRMTHIAVERNRRRQMNDHLNALRSLMPPSYIQRGDQASIIGGAIDFVKELEQILQTLQAHKRIKQSEDQNGDVSGTSTTSTSSSLHQFRNLHCHSNEEGNNNNNNNINPAEEFKFCAENRSNLADIEVIVIQNHVNLKVQCQRRSGQLLKAIVALEDLRFSVLHLNITSFHSLVLYSFNLKIEDDCKLGSADEVASAVHQIFSVISIS